MNLATLFFQFLYYLCPITGSFQLWQLLINANKNKNVVVFSHSSKWDSWFFLVLQLAFDLRVTGFCYYTFFKIPILGSILTKAGLIPVQPKRYGGKGGMTQTVIDMLNARDNGFVFLVSPQGGISKAEWEKGFYTIAKATNAKIHLIGLDYEYFRIMTSHVAIDPQTTSFEETIAILKHDIAYCRALHPYGIEPPCVYDADRHTYMVNLVYVSSWLFPLIWLWLDWKNWLFYLPCVSAYLLTLQQINYLHEVYHQDTVLIPATLLKLQFHSHRKSFSKCAEESAQLQSFWISCFFVLQTCIRVLVYLVEWNHSTNWQSFLFHSYFFYLMVCPQAFIKQISNYTRFRRHVLCCHAIYLSVLILSHLHSS
jgi:1-acyl-sn-glycerol-3-phosphate acyltransferase